MIEMQLLRQAYNLTFKLHNITSILLPYHQHFELYFRTELSTHDLQTVFSTQLTSVLRKKWKGMSFHDCFKKVLLKIFLYKFEVDEHSNKIFKLEIALFFHLFFFF